MPYLVPGFHGVRETLRRGQVKIKALWIAEGKQSARVREIIRSAETKGIPVCFKKAKDLSSLLPDMAHQGIAAVMDAFPYTPLKQIIETSSTTKGHTLLLAADHITDGGNLGAIIRAAGFFGAHGLIIPKDRSASVDAKVLKRSSGAYVHVPISRIVNLGRALDELEKAGFWIIGASGEGRQSIYDFDWNRDVVMILGNEKQGLSRSVRRRCHEVVGIPSSGHVESLNVAVACGVILSEILRQRKCEVTIKSQ